jgi:hypothetical protein
MTYHIVADSRLVPVIFNKNLWLDLLKHFLALVPATSAAPKGRQDPCYVQGPLFIMNQCISVMSNYST